LTLTQQARNSSASIARNNSPSSLNFQEAERETLVIDDRAPTINNGTLQLLPLLRSNVQSMINVIPTLIPDLGSATNREETITEIQDRKFNGAKDLEDIIDLIPQTEIPSWQSKDNTGEEEVDLTRNPATVRKSSGELVKPVLHRLPRPQPDRPIISKVVHFDLYPEKIRYFHQADKSVAINNTSDIEFPFLNETCPGTETLLVKEQIFLTEFPHYGLACNILHVKLEKVWLSDDQSSMLGSVVVTNLAFQKHVSCRFTLNYWKTTSEVDAEYCHTIYPCGSHLGQDRFVFSLKILNTTHYKSTTLFFCLRYSVNGQEYWDNNSSANFQVDFSRATQRLEM
jgi:hypothetical protein